MTNAFESAREKVRNSVSSIFSKSDVLQLLIDAESEHRQVTADESGVEEVFDQLQEAVEGAINDFDFDSYTDVHLDGREVVVDFDCSNLTDTVETAMDRVRERFTEK